MGDRVWCDLRINGHASLKMVQNIIEKSEMHATDWNAEQGWFGFDEVNYAQQDGNLKEELKKAGIPFSWEWGAGCEFPAGIIIFDPALGEEEFSVSDGEILLRLSDATSQSTVSTALAFASSMRRQFHNTDNPEQPGATRMSTPNYPYLRANLAQFGYPPRVIEMMAHEAECANAPNDLFHITAWHSDGSIIGLTLSQCARMAENGNNGAEKLRDEMIAAAERAFPDLHASDCATHNEPAIPAGECDCKPEVRE